jgi:hypothetical protein
MSIPRDEIEPVLKSLSAEAYISLTVNQRNEIELTEEGRGYAQNGSPEYQFVMAMQVNESVDLPTMETRVGAQIAKIG